MDYNHKEKSLSLTESNKKIKEMRAATPTGSVIRDAQNSAVISVSHPEEAVHHLFSGH